MTWIIGLMVVGVGSLGAIVYSMNKVRFYRGKATAIKAALDEKKQRIEELKRELNRDHPAEFKQFVKEQTERLQQWDDRLSKKAKEFRHPGRKHLMAVAKFELMEEEQARKVLAGRNERDPLVCALLTLLHEAKADAAMESNLADNPEWLAQRCAGGLHWLLQFEADLKEALSAAAEPPPEKTET